MNYKYLKLTDIPADAEDTLINMADAFLECDETIEKTESNLLEFMGLHNGWEDLLIKASELRKAHLQDIFGDAQVIVIDRPDNAEQYREFMASVIIYAAMPEYKTEKARNFISQLTHDVIRTGVLEKDVKVGEKTFRAGSKFTRALNHFAEITNSYNMKSRLVGNFQPQAGNNEPVFLSYSPWAISEAAIIGYSCLSPDGENHHAMPVALGYKNMFVASNGDMSWRAWVFVDVERKLYRLGKGYPREKYELQLSVMEFMREKGYKLAQQNIFYLPEYMDLSGIYQPVIDPDEIAFIDTQLKRLNLTTYINENRDYESRKNNDAYYDWLNSLNYGFSSKGRIAEVFHCDVCDRTQLYEFESGGEYCDDCYNHTPCHICYEPINTDYEGYWNHEEEEYYCEYCYREKIEEVSKSTRLERTASFIYNEMNTFFMELGFESFDYGEYYESLNDDQRSYMMRWLARGLVFNEDYQYLEGLLNWETEIDVPREAIDLLNRPYTGDAREALRRWSQKVIEFYDYRWIDGMVEV